MGLIIANQPSLQRKITMQERQLCWPPYFFLGPAVAPSFFILESPLLPTTQVTANSTRCFDVPQGMELPLAS